MSEKTEDTKSPTADSADITAADEAIEVGNESVIAEEQQDVEKKQGLRIILLLVIIVSVLLGGLAASGQLQPLHHAFTDWVAGLSVRSPAPPSPPTLATSEEVQSLLKKIDNLQSALGQKTEAQKQLSPQPDETAEMLRTKLSELTRELNALRNDTIASLSAELHQATAAQKTLRAGLQQQQQMNLQVRLRWITDPASRLPQIKLAWEEISLLGGLSDEQRAQAEDMHVLARDTVQKLRQWQASMQKWADTLAVPLQQDMLPKPKQLWLAWAIGHFHLRSAPPEEARHLTRLRNELENIISQLTTETWPAVNDWQRLRAQLVLQARSRRAKNSTEPVNLNLPGSFEPVKSDINTLKQTAQQWLGQL